MVTQWPCRYVCYLLISWACLIYSVYIWLSCCVLVSAGSWEVLIADTMKVAQWRHKKKKKNECHSSFLLVQKQFFLLNTLRFPFNLYFLSLYTSLIWKPFNISKHQTAIYIQECFPKVQQIQLQIQVSLQECNAYVFVAEENRKVELWLS